MKLYSFVDNHDVDRIASKLQDQACLIPVHALLYFLPGILLCTMVPSLGSAEGKREEMMRLCVRRCP